MLDVINVEATVINEVKGPPAEILISRLEDKKKKAALFFSQINGLDIFF